MFFQCPDIQIINNDSDADFILDAISPRYMKGVGTPTRPVDKGQMGAIEEAIGRMRSGQWQFEAFSCPCGGKGFRVFALRDRFGLPSPLSSCRLCGLLQNNPRLTNSASADFYENFYRRIYMGWEPAALFADQRVRGRRLLSWLSHHAFSLQAGDVVLEIGTGAGGILSVFEEVGCSVAGCDFDPRFLSFGKDHGLDLRQGDSSHLPGSAQLVILSHVFEHITDPLGELERVRKMLAPGGAVLIQVPGIEYELLRCHAGGHLVFDFLDYLQNAHAYHYWGPDLLWLANIAGLLPVESDNEITALFTVASDPAPCSTTWSQVQASDPSLCQLQRLRRMETLRCFVGRPAQLFCTLYHGVRAVLKRVLRHSKHQVGHAGAIRS